MSLFRFLFSASKTAKRFWNLSFWHFKSSRSFLFSFCVESSWLEVFWTFLPHSSNFVRMFTITSVCLSTNSFNSLQTTLIQHSFQQQFCDSYSKKCKIFILSFKIFSMKLYQHRSWSLDSVCQQLIAVTISDHPSFQRRVMKEERETLVLD